MNAYKMIYELTYHKLNTLSNLLDHIRYDGYSEVSFKKIDDGFIALLTFQKEDAQLTFFECCFDKQEFLQTIYVIENESKSMIFDREFELALATDSYMSEYENSKSLAI